MIKKKKFQQNATTITTTTKLEHNSSNGRLKEVFNKKDEEPKFTFGDISVNREDISDKLFEETKLDIKLTQLYLIRKKIPKRWSLFIQSNF